MTARARQPAMPADNGPGGPPRKPAAASLDSAGPQWMVAVGVCLFVIGMLCAL